MASATEPTILNRAEEEDHAPAAAEDEDTGAPTAPIIQLQEVAVATGEENEDILLELKAKLYRFDNNQWKERGVGSVKLLKHRETGKIRLVMRQNKTLKICANHIVLPTMAVQEHLGNDKSCVWHATDFADGELKEETFCIRFPSVENCKSFKDKIEEITESLRGNGDNNDAAANPIEQLDNGTNKEADAAANLIEKLSVEEKKTEDKAESSLTSEKEEKIDEKKAETSEDNK